MIFKMPPIIALFLIIISLILHFIFPINLISFPLNLIGIIFIILGIVLMALSFRLFFKKSTPIKPYEKPTALIKEGIYNLSRNPIYLGMVTILLGIATLSGKLMLFLAPLAHFIILHSIFIPREEKVLEKIFGKEYLDYKRKVRKWV